MKKLLEEAYPGVEIIHRDCRFGLEVDFYIPSIHIAFEADGDYWHRLKGVPERDVERDARLLEVHRLPVVRFWESDLKKWAKGLLVLPTTYDCSWI